jgi:hypothetical protein
MQESKIEDTSMVKEANDTKADLQIQMIEKDETINSIK